ncbi:MAG: aromatic hydrocarbon degradation protein [Epsilonproteobacteria bacterium]|nr:aromatic hydrocarbon degradation protein [Campylobacterota bacterium]NPA64792.1 transporter [Campylobacterota bacterium]
MKRALLLSTLAALTLYGAAYKLPEQSARSIALAGAYVAGADHADAAYFNPANMSFMPNESFFELSATAIYLPEIRFQGKVYSPLTKKFEEASARSESEFFLAPHLHWISKEYKGLRFGFSLATPGGLSKRWKSDPQIWSAEEFTLRIVEVNPSFSYALSDKLSIGAGVRAIYSDGKVKVSFPHLYKEKLKGDTDIKWGYNLALSYRYHPDLTLAATYRSKINLKEVGTAKGYLGKYLITKDPADFNTLIPYYTKANVTVPLPATLSLAVALNISETTRVELEYERTYWSKYKRLDFNFDDPFAEAVLGQPKEKNWNDTNTFRIGITHKNSPKLTTMYGFAYDQSPIPDSRVGFELPDADAFIFALGAIYDYTKTLSFGISYLFDYKIERGIEMAVQNNNGIVGKFDEGNAHLLNISLNYRY